MSELARSVAPHDHTVTFYGHEAELTTELARYVADGLAHGERVVVVATTQHRDLLEEVLLQHGEDAVRARVQGRYLTFDARELLDKFLVDDRPDADRFLAAVGSVVDAAGIDGCHVRVFGEMVALLWEAGNVTAALELEELWNGLAATRRFSLLCGYPTSALTSLDDANRVCELHSLVSPPRAYFGRTAADLDPSLGAESSSEVYLPVPAAVAASRRFVASVLTSWGEESLLTDAALVASELATNAVEHAGSPFRVVLRRVEGAVRLSIEDVGPARPERRDAGPDDFGGRGVAIVEKLTRAWGCEPLPDGKLVWAELALAR